MQNRGWNLPLKKLETKSDQNGDLNRFSYVGNLKMSEGPRYQRAVVEVEFGGTYHLMYVFWRLLQATPNSIPGLQKIMFLRKISIEPVYSNGWETMTFFLQSQTASISWPQTFWWNLQKPFVNSNMVRFYPCSLCMLSCSESQIPHSIKPGNLGESLYDGPHLSTYVVPSESTQNFTIRTDFG